MDGKEKKVPKTIWQYFAILGPGIFIMAFHLGPGDVTTHTVIGAKFGTQLWWTLLFGVFFSIVFIEMVGRWTLATDTSVFEGFRHVGKWAAHVMFIGILATWAAFGSATSLAAGLGWQAMIPFPGVGFLVGTRIWGTIMLFVCFAIVWFGVYQVLENIIKVLVIFMSASFIITAIITKPDFVALAKALVPPTIPEGAGWLAMAEISVVVGGVTSIMYSYMVKEKDWNRSWMGAMRFDISVSYVILLILDVAIILAAYRVLMPQGITPNTALDLAQALAPLYGAWAAILFSLGLWGAAMTTLFGAFLGTYAFIDYWKPEIYKGGEEEFRKTREFKLLMLLVLVLCGMFVWVYLGPPIFMMIILYLSGAIWVPVMAIVIVKLTNDRERMGDLVNGRFMKVMGVIIILMGIYIAVQGILSVAGIVPLD